MNRLTSQFLLRDIQLFKWIYNRIRCRFFDISMPYVTYLGGTRFIVGMAIFLLFVNMNLAIELIIILASSHLVVQLIKHLIDRPRPYIKFDNIELKVIPFENYSFPSGHTTASFSLAMFFSLYLPQFILLFFVLAGLIGLSRIYLGVHYPSDVIIGALIGVIFTIFVHLFFI